MDHYCLSRKEYRELLNHIIFSKEVEDVDLAAVITRAKEMWDINVIGSNYFFSIILEQLMKAGEADFEIINRLYEIKEQMYFSIDELNHQLINELFINHLPQKRNGYIEKLDIAKKGNDNEGIAFYEEHLMNSFEEDLQIIISCCYENKIHR